MKLNTDLLQTLKDIPGEKAPSLLTEVLETYLTLSVQTLNELKIAIANNDLNSTRSHAHKMRGGSLNIGADTLGSHFATLEALAKSGNLTGANELFLQIEKDFDLTKEELLKNWIK